MFSTCILSCRTADDYLQKAIAKDPTILESQEFVRVDTIIPDPILIRDTFLTTYRDTLFKVKKEYKVKLIRSFDTIKIDVECLPDTIVRKEVIKLPPKIRYIKQPFWKQYTFPLLIFVALFGLVLFNKITK